MSHDRGTFGKLLGQLMSAGAQGVTFHCDFTRDPEDIGRWEAHTLTVTGYGRTGEEALRRLVDVVCRPSSPDAA